MGCTNIHVVSTEQGAPAGPYHHTHPVLLLLWETVTGLSATQSPGVTPAPTRGVFPFLSHDARIKPSLFLHTWACFPSGPVLCRIVNQPLA